MFETIWAQSRNFLRDTLRDAFQPGEDFANVQIFRKRAIRYILVFFVLVMLANFIATKIFTPKITYHDAISGVISIALLLATFNLHRLRHFVWLWLVLTSALFAYVVLMGMVDKTGIQVGAITLTVIAPIVGVHFVGRLGAIGNWLMGVIAYTVLFFYSLYQPPPNIYFGGYSQIYDLLIMAVLAITLSMIIALTVNEAVYRSLATARLNLYRARASEQERLRFFGAVSHEVRNAINGIFGITSSLLHDDLSKDVRDKVELIQASGNSLIRVLNDTLEITRLESGSMEIASECFDLHQLFAQVSARWQLSASGKKLGFQFEVPDNLPRWVVSDSARIAQVLDNLLSNAVKFTPAGWIRLELEMPEADSENCLLRFTVTDTGCGIQRDRWERIFEPYRQASETTFAQFGGTGLGLYICRLIATQMNGRVWLDRSDDENTVFAFEIPAEICQNDDDNCASRTESSIELLPEFRILAVDDRQPNLRYLETLFKAWDLKLETVNNGADCLVLMTKQPYDLLLLDMNMPGMDGLEVLEHLRNLPPPNNQTTIIVVSADLQDQRREALARLNADIYVTKPLTPEMLWASLVQACQKHQTDFLTPKSDNTSVN